jgi:ATP-dependent DNA ligase
MADRKGIMLCYPLEERRLKDPKFGWSFPVIVQPKLDGERCRVIARGSSEPPILLSSSEETIISVPHISAAIQSLGWVGELDGELYTHGYDQSDIHSVVSRKSEDTLHEEHSAIQLWLFDTVEQRPQLERISKLINLEETPEIKQVLSTLAFSFSEVLQQYREFLEMGYEGIIVRHPEHPYYRKRSRFILKFKPKKTDHYQIIGIVEAISKTGEKKGMLGAFICTSDEGTTFRVGAGELSHERRKQIWAERDQFIGRICIVSYQNLGPGGKPRFGLCADVL